MKAKMFLMMLSFFCLSTMADEPKTHLIVWAKDGTLVEYALAEKPKVTFTETDLVIIANGLEVNYPLKNMECFTYESYTSTDITDLQTDESLFKLNDEMLLFPNLKANSTVSVYSLNGTLVFKKTVQKSGEYAFPLSNLNVGVYMVNVNGLTYKIVKK